MKNAIWKLEIMDWSSSEFMWMLSTTIDGRIINIESDTGFATEEEAEQFALDFINAYGITILGPEPARKESHDRDTD